MLAEKETSAAEQLALARTCDQHGAYCTIDQELSVGAARAADAAFEAGVRLGPLQGVPISVKDLYGVPGYSTYAGSTQRLPARFEAAGPLISKLRAQLGVIVGKTHTVEFAFGGVGTNPHYPTPINPWSPDAHRAPGGSSAGAGVSLSEGSAHLALGTDTAGSVRIPASWTGNAGLKTTKGRWSTEGVVPLSSSLDTTGILTRTADDLAFAFAALDPNPGDLSPRPLSGARFGRVEKLLFEGCSPGVVEAVDAALSLVGAQGARVVDLELPELQEVKALFDAGGPVSAELYSFLSRELPPWLEALDPNVQARIGDAGRMPAHEYLARLARMADLKARVLRRMEGALPGGVDVLVCPTVANSPPQLSEIDTPERYKPQNLLCLRNTCVASYLGLCAVTVPVGLDRNAMPVGLQLIGKPDQEAQLIGLARALTSIVPSITAQN